MTYTEWSTENTKKRDAVLDKLSDLTPKEKTEYFVFENMQKNEPDFCGLYKQDKKCHDIQYLNCFNCACPHFIFTENEEGFFKQDGKPVMSYCAINAKKGSQFIDKVIHHDCSNCSIPHTLMSVLKSLAKYK